MLEELQNLSEANKKKVLIISTIIIMVIVVGIWLSYLNSIVSAPFAAEQQEAQEGSASIAASATASGPGFWQETKDFFAGIGHLFTGSSQYSIRPRQ